MKIFFAFATLLAFAPSFAGASGLVVRATTGTAGGACAAYDDLLKSELDDDDRRRDLEGGGGDHHRKLPWSRWCSKYCKGFWPCTCKRAYPWCDECRRRDLEEEMTDRDLVSSSDDGDDGLDDYLLGLFVITDLASAIPEDYENALAEMISQDHTFECAKAVTALQVKMELLAEEGVDDEDCKALLLDRNKIWHCFGLSA